MGICWYWQFVFSTTTRNFYVPEKLKFCTHTHTHTHIYIYIYISLGIVEVKQSHYSSGQTLRVPGGWGSQISKQSAHDGGKFVSLTYLSLLPPVNTPGNHFRQRLSQPQGNSAAVSMEIINDTIGNRTRNLLVCKRNASTSWATACARKCTGEKKTRYNV